MSDDDDLDSCLICGKFTSDSTFFLGEFDEHASCIDDAAIIGWLCDNCGKLLKSRS